MNHLCISAMNIKKHITVLVVDDEEPIRKLLKSFLKNIGIIDIIEARDGKQAFDIMQKETVNLVIADWLMPHMSGIQLLQKIRSTEKFKNLPFVMVTSVDGKDEILSAMQSQVSQYIVKPFTADTFQKKLAIVLKQLEAQSLS